jgi:hypothetical protein
MPALGQGALRVKLHTHDGQWPMAAHLPDGSSQERGVFDRLLDWAATMKTSSSEEATIFR